MPKTCLFKLAVLRKFISENIDGIVGEIERWKEILD
jgi:hypothetical protein